MFNRNRIETTFVKPIVDRVSRLRSRTQLRLELEATSDRALAELGLGRGDVGDVVAGTYRVA